MESHSFLQTAVARLHVVKTYDLKPIDGRDRKFTEAFWEMCMQGLMVGITRAHARHWHIYWKVYPKSIESYICAHAVST